MLTCEQLAELPEVELGKRDIADTHLAMAAGLPGSERIAVPEYLGILHEWMKLVRRETRRLRPQFDKHRDVFQTWARFRAHVMVTVLQRNVGIRCDRKLNDNPDCSDSRDLFIHGIIETGKGNCSSLPVLYAAIGRRLGYPIRLVSTACHLFARWQDDTGERFNIECTTPGFDSPPDEYYLTWPKSTTPAEVQRGEFLKTNTPREELAGFFVQRSFCLVHNGRFREAVEAIAWSQTLQPRCALHGLTLSDHLCRWEHHLNLRLPPPFPRLVVERPPPRFPSLPPQVQERMYRLEVLDALSRDPAIRSLYRPSVPRSPQTGLPIGAPAQIVVQRIRSPESQQPMKLVPGD